MALLQTSSRLRTTENLPSGSTYDLLLISIPDGFPVGQIEFKFEDTPRKITGIQKVAQFFVRVLFTQKGTDILHPNFGTSFPELAIGANRTSDDSEFLKEVTLAVKDAENQTRSMLASATKDLASQLDKVSITGLSTDTEALLLYIQIVTLAGETASVAVPFPELDLKLAAG